ncbi:hypothetical protein BJ508DRAFT_376030 [Ascobolus immersus RN42]|uniref:Uncharacterized protein n=1 Tax=Ascobolus immersus RN42 TaxID=1160509 RepID=A0A3N4I9H9_ASCIM|nr:hypothetical protein BJ508DRAFT_376030 [Ascobolus immersus RN42]
MTADIERQVTAKRGHIDTKRSNPRIIILERSDAHLCHNISLDWKSQSFLPNTKAFTRFSDLKDDEPTQLQATRLHPVQVQAIRLDGHETSEKKPVSILFNTHASYHEVLEILFSKLRHDERNFDPEDMTVFVADGSSPTSLNLDGVNQFMKHSAPSAYSLKEVFSDEHGIANVYQMHPGKPILLVVWFDVDASGVRFDTEDLETGDLEYHPPVTVPTAQVDALTEPEITTMPSVREINYLEQPDVRFDIGKLEYHPPITVPTVHAKPLTKAEITTMMPDMAIDYMKQLTCQLVGVPEDGNKRTYCAQRRLEVGQFRDILQAGIQYLIDGDDSYLNLGPEAKKAGHLFNVEGSPPRDYRKVFDHARLFQLDLSASGETPYLGSDIEFVLSDPDTEKRLWECAGSLVSARMIRHLHPDTPHIKDIYDAYGGPENVPSPRTFLQSSSIKQPTIIVINGIESLAVAGDELYFRKFLLSLSSYMLAGFDAGWVFVCWTCEDPQVFDDAATAVARLTTRLKLPNTSSLNQNSERSERTEEQGGEIMKGKGKFDSFKLCHGYSFPDSSIWDEEADEETDDPEEGDEIDGITSEEES